MPFEKVKFEFPDGDAENETALEVEGGTEVEIDLGGEDKAPASTTKEDDVSETSSDDKAKDDDDVELEIVDDTPEQDRGRKKSDPPEEVTDDELKNYSEGVQKRIKHFTKGYHDERREKEKAIRERQALEEYSRKLVEENKRLKGTSQKSNVALLEQAKRVVATEVQTARDAYRLAYEAGDADKLMEAEEKLAIARQRAARVESVKLPPLQENDSGVQPETSYEQNVEAPQAAPVDPKFEDWRAENTWFGTDDELTSFALGAHNKLVNNGVDPTSDEYYEQINARMREVFPTRFEDTPKTKTPTRSKSNNVVAPASRSAAPKKITLSKSQVAIANRLGVPLKEYARQVAEGIRNQND